MKSDDALQFIKKNYIKILFGLALLVRLVGICWGGQLSDENISAPAKVLTGKLVPDLHYYPPLLNYLHAVAYAVLYLLGRMMNFWHATSAFREQYFDNPALFLTTLRLCTAFFGALVAPFAAMTARKLTNSWVTSFITGSFLALLPTHVLLSHIVKHDILLTTSLFIVLYLFASRLNAASNKTDFQLGFSIALALSLKQSSVFFLFPLALAFLACWSESFISDRNQAIASIMRISVAAFSLMPILNIGIVLDIKNFLEYQKVLAMMWKHDDIFFVDGIVVFGRQLVTGINSAVLPLLLLSLALPLIRRDRITIAIWCSTLIAALINSIVSGGQSTAFHQLPHITLLTFLGALGAATLAERTDLGKIVRIAPLTVSALCTVVGATFVLYQSIQPSVAVKVAAEITRQVDSEKSKILSGMPFLDTYLKRNPKSKAAERARDERLAKKYAVELPPFEKERLNSRDVGYFIQNFPWVMGKLETHSETEFSQVKPFSWPLQEEEWKLEYWLNQGFNTFITRDESFYLNCAVKSYREFHEEIKRRCELLKEIPATKPLFWERSVNIYRCSNA